MKNICLWLLCLMIATGAQADGDDALRRFVVNAGHVGLKMSLPISQLRVQPTLVTGIYALSAPNGDFAGYINEAGSLHGDARGFKHVVPQWRDLTPAETADLRAAVLAVPSRVASRLGLDRHASAALDAEIRQAMEVIADD